MADEKLPGVLSGKWVKEGHQILLWCFLWGLFGPILIEPVLGGAYFLIIIKTILIPVLKRLRKMY